MANMPGTIIPGTIVPISVELVNFLKINCEQPRVQGRGPEARWRLVSQFREAK
jgi:hypothetical protein